MAFPTWQRCFCLSWTALVLEFSIDVDARLRSRAVLLAEKELRAATRGWLPDLTVGQAAFRVARLLLAMNEATDVAWTSFVVEATVGYLQSTASMNLQNASITAEALQLGVLLLGTPALDDAVGTRRGELEAAVSIER